jgi:hypothetical protein
MRELNKERDFAGNLLGYAMGSTGNFSYDREAETLGFTPGGTMPSKTESWNNYIQMKGGQVGPGDIVKFNALYSQAQGIQTQSQLDELSKLRMQGADDDDIQDLVGQNPQMYNNLLDMITRLESQPDQTGQNSMMATNMKAFLPQEEKSYLGQAWDAVTSNVPASLAIGAGSLYAYNKLQDPAVQKWFKGYLKDPAAAQQLDKLLKTPHADGGLKYRLSADGKLQERVQGRKTQVFNKDGKPRMKGGKPVFTRGQSGWRNVTPGLPYATEATKTFTASQLKSARNILKYSTPQTLLQMVGYSVAPALAEKATGSKKAGEAVRTAFDLSFLASGGRMLMKVPGWQAKLAGGAMVLAGGAGLGGYTDE